VLIYPTTPLRRRPTLTTTPSPQTPNTFSLATSTMLITETHKDVPTKAGGDMSTQQPLAVAAWD